MLKIEFLYYDKTACKRCKLTDKSLRSALNELKKAVKKAKIKISVEKKELPQSKIHLSPTILINNRDVEKLVSKNSKQKSGCVDCCKLAGHPVSCRTFSYKGRSYDYIPKEMVIEAVEAVLGHKAVTKLSKE